MDHFELHSEYKPTGDQPQAIERLVRGFKEGNQFETLLGVTGSGKTFTMANVIAQLNKPTLILAHNKTLAAQLYGEMKEFFPENAVEYFVSYYDYYQPEAYVPSSDTYIAKDSSINDEIDKLRLSATAAMSERKDVVVISSVSCIYGLGSPQEFFDMMISLRPGMTKDRDEVIRELIDIQYTRNEMDFHRSTFRVRGDTLEIFPANSSDTAVRVEFFGDEIDRISEIDVLTGEIKCQRSHISIFPASHYVVPAEQIQRAAVAIEEELKERVEYFKSEDKLLEAQRISERTNFDIEMMKETGFCSGIENYSRHLSGLKPGQPPYTLLDYFGDDFLLIIDESHITVPQVGGMYAGDQSRKQTLVDYGFRLPSAKDNRPLSFEEFESKLDQVMFVSATPGQYEYDHELLRAEQIIRPTGLLDPKVEVRPIEGQIDDLIGEVNKEVSKKHKILITTLTKRMAEDLTEYMKEVGISVDIKYTLVVSFKFIVVENIFDLVTYFISVSFTSLLCHFNTAVWHESTFQRFICLKTNNFFKVFCFFINISGTICCQRCNHLCLHIKNSAFGTFFFLKCLELAPQFVCSFCRSFQERSITFIWCIVHSNKVTYIDFFFPTVALKAIPLFEIFHSFTSFSKIFPRISHWPGVR